jgi:hypothetical protein
VSLFAESIQKTEVFDYIYKMKKNEGGPVSSPPLANSRPFLPAPLRPSLKSGATPQSKKRPSEGVGRPGDQVTRRGARQMVPPWMQYQAPYGRAKVCACHRPGHVTRGVAVQAKCVDRAVMRNFNRLFVIYSKRKS